jgi:hypothetical protein
MRATTFDIFHRAWAETEGLLGRLRDGLPADFSEGQDGLKALLDPAGGLPADYLGPGGGDPFLGSAYFVVALLDELFIDSPWHDPWNRVKLETWRYGSNDRAARFWEQAEQAERRPGSDAREVALAAALLGFRGDRREQPDELRHWVRRTAEAVEAQHQVQPPERHDDGEPPTHVPPRPAPPVRPVLSGSAADTVAAPWRAAVKTLRQRGIDLRDRRLFLLLGNPAGGVAGLVAALHALHQGREVLIVPERDSPAPFRLLVCDEAIYLLWTGTGAPPADGAGCGLDSAVNPSAPPFKTLFVGAAGHAPRDSTDELCHLCGLLTAARAPYAPVNGIALLLPWDGLATEPAADALAAGHVGMLTAARDALGMVCPVVAIACDLERAAGYREFVQALGEGQASRRLGLSLPWLRRPGAEKMRGLIDGGLAWLIDGEVRRAVFAAMTRDLLDDPLGPPGRNGRLFRFLGEMRRRRPGLRRGLARVADALLDGAEWPLFAGFYFAGTGAGPGEQAFLPGALRRLHDGHDYLAWRAPRPARRPRAWLAYLLSGAAAVAGAGALLWHYHHPLR